jgi:hypothetical protein
MIDLWKYNDTLTGVVNITGIKLEDNKWVYFFGEDHNFNGTSNKHMHIIELIFNKYAEEKLHILIESGFKECVKVAMNNEPSKSPIQTIMKKYINNIESISNKHDVILANIRRDDPYTILELLYGFHSYIYIYGNTEKLQNKKQYILFRKMAKMFESDMIKHLSSRLKTEKLILCLLHPNYKLPIWYTKWCQLFGHEGKEHNIKEKIKKSMHSKKIIAFITSEIETRLLNMDKYSENVNKLDENSENFVLDKNKKLNIFFTFLFGLIMDVYILLELLESKLDTIIFAGELHNHMIIKFLSQSQYSNETWSVNINDMGYLDKKNITVPAYINIVQDSPTVLFYGGSGLSW